MSQSLMRCDRRHGVKYVDGRVGSGMSKLAAPQSTAIPRRMPPSHMCRRVRNVLHRFGLTMAVVEILYPRIAKRICPVNVVLPAIEVGRAGT